MSPTVLEHFVGVERVALPPVTPDICVLVGSTTGSTW